MSATSAECHDCQRTKGQAGERRECRRLDSRYRAALSIGGFVVPIAYPGWRARRLALTLGYYRSPLQGFQIAASPIFLVALDIVLCEHYLIKINECGGRDLIMNQILFYRISGPYGEFSNFSPQTITLKDKQWATVEHYFQAQKFAGTEHEEAVRQAKSPMIAARMGRSRERPLRADWETVKDDVMREALCAKFTQNPRLGSLLLATGDAVIVEHTKNDSYWADGGDGSGKNRLGELLMELREELRTEEGKK
jgi:N-glycosidase YbiA